MNIMISIPDDCKPLADAVERLVSCSQRAMKRANGGRAVDYAQIEREVGERTAEIERGPPTRRFSRPSMSMPRRW